jgi:hypothetical protein
VTERPRARVRNETNGASSGGNLKKKTLTTDFQKRAKGATEPYDFSARCVNPRIYSSSEPSTFPVFGLTKCA